MGSDQIDIQDGQMIDGDVVAPTRRKRLERATLMGIGLSIGIHFLIMLIAALITVDFKFADAGGDTGEEIGFAILTSAEMVEMASPKIEHESFEVAIELNEQVLEIDLLSDINQDQSVSDLADSIAPQLSGGGQSLTSDDELAGNSGSGSGDGASFFGLEAQGRRFAYIVDFSGSMDTLTGDGAFSRWDLTRSELIRSLEGFDQQAEFFVTLYASHTIKLFGNNEWIRAEKKKVRQAATAMYGIEPRGSTQPIPAFEAVFDLEPRPDAIYFMTDGLLDTEVPAQIRALNRRSLIPIHCILFGELASVRDATAALNMMRTIARNSGGRFTHVKESKP